MRTRYTIAALLASGAAYLFKKGFYKGFGKQPSMTSKKKSEDQIEKVPLSGEAINLDTLRDKDTNQKVSFYDTENSSISRGEPKAIPKGLDSFGEKDTFDIDEVDDYQTNRDRNQNSDLAQRFYTRGLDSDVPAREKRDR